MKNRLLLNSYEFFSHLVEIVNNYQGKERHGILYTFLYLSFRYLVLEKIFGIKNRRVRIHGFEFFTPNMRNLVNTYRELFIQKQYYFRSARQDPLILDVGSNLGLSIIYFKFIYPQCQIKSFEANPETYKFLQKNIAANNLQKITTTNVAVAASEGVVELYVNSQDARFDDRASILPNAGLRQDLLVKKSVNSVKLSDYLAEKVDLIKIDVEGAEGVIFQEIQNNLEKVKNIVFEFHQRAYSEQNRISDILKVLEDNNFQVRIVSGRIGFNEIHEYPAGQNLIVAASRGTEIHHVSVLKRAEL